MSYDLKELKPKGLGLELKQQPAWNADSGVTIFTAQYDNGYWLTTPDGHSVSASKLTFPKSPTSTQPEIWKSAGCRGIVSPWVRARVSIRSSWSLSPIPSSQSPARFCLWLFTSTASTYAMRGSRSVMGHRNAREQDSAVPSFHTDSKRPCFERPVMHCRIICRRIDDSIAASIAKSEVSIVSPSRYACV